MKQKGDWISGKYQVINAFLFVEGTLYFASLNGEAVATRFIHAIPMYSQPNQHELDELLNRNREIFFPIQEVLIEDGVFYQVFDRMEGDLFPIYLKQMAPLSFQEIAQVTKKLSNHLLQCYDEDQFAYVDLQNMVRSPEGEIRFLFGGPMSLFGIQRQEAVDSKRLGEILFAMLTGQFISNGIEDTKQLRIRRPDLPLDLERLIVQAFHVDPTKRPRIRDFWKWAHQFLEQIETTNQKINQANETLPSTANPMPSVPQKPKAKPPVLARGAKLLNTKNKKKRLWIILGSVVGIFLLLFIGSAIFGDSPADVLGDIYIDGMEEDEKKAFRYFQESTVAYDQKQLEKAIEAGRKALSSDLEQKGYYLHLANLYGVANDYKKGKQVLEAAILQFPEDAELYDALSVHAYYLKDYNRALEAVNKAVELDGSNGGYLYHQGKVYFALKQYDQAVKALQLATYVNRKSPRYNHDLAVALYHTGKLDDAINYAKVAVKEASSSKEKYHMTLGKLYLKKWEQVYKDTNLEEAKKKEELKNWAKLAYRQFDSAVDEEKDYAEALYYRSVSHYLYGHFVTAEIAAEKAAKLDPKNPLYHYQLGLAYIASGKREDALKALEKAYELDANNEFIQLALKKAQGMR